ncbi:aryl hydrocarbon receptor nuclear translocator-like protein 2 isoform X2 [Carassius gibelio]|uniref:aryl hydrocarbon receptor nuclear translocator-like protein 2 isoform X2 n=1 Tax=Carassius gibelio TaxID=101364 RepID=UPI0022787F58|nr:aryl hydrocarbon receptor nuclear translocator-like protein 2 isoform X2 [Carassius gibelio]
MSARNTAAGGGDGAVGEKTGDALEEEPQGLSVSLFGLMTPSSAAGMASGIEMPRKRKGSMDNLETKSASNLEEDMEDDQGRSEGDDQQLKIKCIREPHSQIEKRRRDKMNNLIDELAAMIPTCNPMSRKLDKLTVLRMAVQHLKSLKGATSSFAEANYKPAFLPDDELKHLVLKAADGFLFVVGCDRGKIIFASESVSKILNYSRTELIGQSLFDYVHPKDIGKVKEQLSATELYPRERLIDAKTGLQVQAEIPVGAARLCSGARRSFFCRMKYNKVTIKEEKVFQAGASKKKDWQCLSSGREPKVQDSFVTCFIPTKLLDSDFTLESVLLCCLDLDSIDVSVLESQRYCTVHCTGYMRTWPKRQLGTEGEAEADKESSHFSCLVAVGRMHPHTLPQANGEIKVKPTEFVTRYAMDGKFTFVDQRATTILGYLPQELLGTSCYEYFHLDDLPHLADRHRKVLRSKEKIETNCYKFKTKYGSFVTLQSQWFSFINPWTKEVEYIVSTNTVISGKSNPGGSGDKAEQPSSSKASEDDAKKSQQVPIIPGISSASGMIYAGCIGTQIANEIMDYNRMNSSPSSGNTSPFSVPQEKSPLALVQASSNVPNGEATDVEMTGKSGSVEEARGGAFTAGENLMEGSSQLDLESVPGLGALSTDEAAMAVIMSLLETDANLVDFVALMKMGQAATLPCRKGGTYVTELYEWFRKFLNECPSGLITLHEFRRHFCNGTVGKESAEYAEQIFRTLDNNGVLQSSKPNKL